MHQIVQNIRDGKLSLVEVPDPVVKPGHVLIANAFSVVSVGTERMAIELGKKSLLGKAKERPDQVRRVIEKWHNEGFFNTLAQVREKLDEPIPMGYSSAGHVLAWGAGVANGKTKKIRLKGQGKGHREEIETFARALVNGGPTPIPWDEIYATTLASILAVRSIREGIPFDIPVFISLSTSGDAPKIL